MIKQILTSGWCERVGHTSAIAGACGLLYTVTSTTKLASPTDSDICIPALSITLPDMQSIDDHVDDTGQHIFADPEEKPDSFTTLPVPTHQKSTYSFSSDNYAHFSYAHTRLSMVSAFLVLGGMFLANVPHRVYGRNY